MEGGLSVFLPDLYELAQYIATALGRDKCSKEQAAETQAEYGHRLTHSEGQSWLQSTLWLSLLPQHVMWEAPDFGTLLQGE